MYVILPMIQHLYFCGKNLGFVLTKLDEHSIMAIEWFENNYMKMNSDKFTFLSRETNLNIYALK